MFMLHDHNQIKGTTALKEITNFSVFIIHVHNSLPVLWILNLFNAEMS